MSVKVWKIKSGFIWLLLPIDELIFHVTASQSETDLPPLLCQRPSDGAQGSPPARFPLWK